MRARLSLSALRPCPNATPGPSSRPAICLTRYNAPLQARHESTSTKSKTSSIFTPSSTAVSAYPHPAFDQLSTSLSSWLPCFGARGDEVRLLNSPTGFYQDVIEMLKRAKRRILISTLYIGVEETELVSGFLTYWKILMNRSRRYGKH
jgi:CDP-diacylglycerol--glycerol-3-phosphate 3-phosphatidyltransferase